MLLGWIAGFIIYLLFMAHDTYRVCYAPVRSDIHPERSRNAQ